MQNDESVNKSSPSKQIVQQIEIANKPKYPKKTDNASALQPENTYQTERSTNKNITNFDSA